ncbi:MAG TPA: S-layer homology domain-containing protein [Acetivibrio sp.]|uniref:S-layer homology domain-containing protein n=1 Tax=Acetivibrio sp. TaxID=1872092 RepID=UPI002BFCC75D|nr:S-layer homology domain-containing protein [Acetivibrio sp.]HOM02822.1 S-layer homology domain-containing protein [Acetivibrio sp.]
MNIKTVCVSIILILHVLLVSVQNVSAHGAVYETRQIDENKIRITLKWSDEDKEKNKGKGIAIAYYYLVNGKTLYIGYETVDTENRSYLDYDLTGAVPPLRIILSNIDDADWVPFNDIKGIEAKEYITHLHDAGIVNGMPDGSFRPESNITRAEFMVLLVKALNLEGTAEDTFGFTDIDGHWARDIILVAAKHGLISGYEDGTVRPDRPITLAEACSVIARAFNFKTTKNGIYSKLNPDKWYSKSVKKMFDVGILSVNDSLYKNFNEEAPIDRANCSMMVSRALSTY